MLRQLCHGLATSEARRIVGWRWIQLRRYQKRKMREVRIWSGDVVEVEYCTEQDYYEHYRILKEKLMTEFTDLVEVRGNPYSMPRRFAFEVLWRRGEDLQEELWSKYASGEPSTPDATYGVTEVIVYDLQQLLKKYGVNRGRYVERFPASVEEMDYYRDLHEENERIRDSRYPRWPSKNRRSVSAIMPSLTMSYGMGATVVKSPSTFPAPMPHILTLTFHSDDALHLSHKRETSTPIGPDLWCDVSQSAEKRSWDAPSIVGTCSEMCPAGEVQRRKEYNQIHALEHNAEDPSDTTLVIKAYYRTLDDRTRQPEYLRNRIGVALSMDRLRVLMDRSDVSFEKRASFIWDRYRGIWKGMSIQSWTDMFRVTVLEEVARFMIFADFEVTRVAIPEGRLSYQDRYDTELGIRLLNQCFVTLSELYEAMRAKQEPCPNEFEFRVYHLLLQMTPVEGRDLEHDEIVKVHEQIPTELREQHGEKMQLLNELYIALKEHKWDCITDLIWPMDFFEFALGRRIMRRFREIRFLRYYARLRRNRTLHTTQPMPLETFCDVFFLDHEGAMQFAQVHGLNVIQDENNHPHVVIHEGFKKASDLSPSLGCGLPEFAYLTGHVSISDFVIQRPTVPLRPRLNFPCRLLMWPTYHQGLQELEAYRVAYGVSDYEAARIQQDHWHKYTHLEVLNEIPQEAERQPDGTVQQRSEICLPWFRTVVSEPEPRSTAMPPTAVEPTEVSIEVESEAKSEDSEMEEGELPPESAIAEMDSRIAMGELPTTESPSKGADKEMALDQLTFEPWKHPVATDDGHSEPAVTSERVSQPSKKKAKMQSETETPSQLMAIHSFTQGQFDRFVEEAEKLSRPHICIRDAPAQYNGLDLMEPQHQQQPAPQAAPLPINEERYLPRDADLQWAFYRYRHPDHLQGENLDAIRSNFNREYTDRFYKLKEYEARHVSSGWRIPPAVKEQLLDFVVPWNDPELVPTCFPPKLSHTKLLEAVGQHSSVQSQLMTPDLAQRSCGRQPKSLQYCSFILLHDGPIHSARLPQNWLHQRLFKGSDTEEGTHLVAAQKQRIVCVVHGAVAFGQYKRFQLTYSYRRCDISDLTETTLNCIKGASALFVILDDVSRLSSDLEQLGKVLQVFGAERPPLVIFEALDYEDYIDCDGNIRIFPDQHSRTHTQLLHQTLEGTPCFNRWDISVMELSHHVERIKTRIFEQFCNDWKPYALEHHLEHDGCPFIPQPMPEHSYDPLIDALTQIYHSAIVKDAAEGPETETPLAPRELDALMKKWERQWSRIRVYQDRLNLPPDVLHQTAMKLRLLDSP